jgi:Protein of unknown function (DUF1194)
MRARSCRVDILFYTILSTVVLMAAGRASAREISLALVLAFDVSGSVSPGRFDLQRDGYAKAFGSREFIDAIRTATRRSIAVTLVEWSGAREQEQVIGWTVIEDEASSKAFGKAIAGAPRSFYGRTSISSAIDYCAALLHQNGLTQVRSVIDISGDGRSNDGRAVTGARDDAVAAGLTINGLPILTEERDLDDYYRDNVIGGPDSFLIKVTDPSHFAEAILKKLSREVARADDTTEVRERR